MTEPSIRVGQQIDESLYQTDRYRSRLRWGMGWRWEKARWIIERGLHISRRRDDALTVATVRYQHLLARCMAKGVLERVEQEMPAFVQARALSLSPGRQRLELECRLLARQTDQEIAQAMGLSPEVVATFEGVFYAVRDWLHASGLILFQVIGVPAATAEGGPGIPTLMKLSSYRHGPAVIDAWLKYLDRVANPSAGPLDLGTPDGRAVASIEFFVAAASLPSDEVTNMHLLKAFPLLARISKDSASMQSASRLFSEHATRSLDDSWWEALETQLGGILGPTHPVGAREGRGVA